MTITCPMTLCDQIGEKSLGQKIWSTHIFRDARIKLKTSRILTSILLSDPVRDQTSIFKVTSCLITSSKTQPKSTESRNFFADNEFSFFSLFFEMNLKWCFWYEKFLRAYLVRLAEILQKGRVNQKLSKMAHQIFPDFSAFAGHGILNLNPF